MTLFSILIDSKIFQFVCEGGDGIEGLMKAFDVVVGYVDVEHVLPLLADDGQGLDVGEVELVE